MIPSERVSRTASRGGIGSWARARARWHGHRDATASAARRPLTVRVGTAPVPGLALTPYAREVWDTARLSTQQLRSALIRDRRDLLARLRAESVRVVTQYDVRHVPAPAALARYGYWVAQWQGEADLCRARAQAVVDHCNQRLACYWDALNEVWAGGGPPDPRLALAREPLASPLPDRIQLDTSWYEPAIWLLDDDGARRTATSRALEILQQQAAGLVDVRTGR